MDTTAIVVVTISELVALWMGYRIWRSSNSTAEKIAISVVALVPVFGPALALFLHNDPGPAHPAFRDKVRTRTDVLDRWRHVFDEKDPVVRQRKWRGLMGRHHDDEA
ncbi:MAG: hypothetical protein EON58_08390 [Alphaproteobacteria bacterium]|nr:MAG: hypothetical protein EON58_08390 [Alphaproteobacteria bacterium]